MSQACSRCLQYSVNYECIPDAEEGAAWHSTFNGTFHKGDTMQEHIFFGADVGIASKEPLILRPHEASMVKRS